MNIDSCNNVRGSSWAKRVNSIVDQLGLTDIRTSFDNSVNYLPLLKCRLRDQFMQDWKASIDTSPKLFYYFKIKGIFEYEAYLDKISNNTIRKHLTRFRLSSHNLEIELGRYHGIDRENRICKLCNLNTIESEFQFLLCCPKYSDFRKKYLGILSWPNKFKIILTTKNKNKLLNLGKFLMDSYACRKNTLENMTAS
jgi:hypothetical protein